MGVQFIQKDLYDDDYEHDYDYECSTCFSFAPISNILNATKKQQALNSTFQNDANQSNEQHCSINIPNLHQNQSIKNNIFPSKDLVGNRKEFRIKNNKYNLRIIGNGNCIRIAHNSGNVQIIGNSTRLKITKNNGHIKYTGNEGRICLGSESTDQTVDYIGCNGLLKVVNFLQLNKSPNYNTCINDDLKNKNVNNSNSNNNKNKNKRNNEQTKLEGNANLGTSPISSKTSNTLTLRMKSASFDELDRQHENWQLFNDTTMFQQEGWQNFTKVSLPNLKDSCNCDCKCKKNRNNSLINNLNKKTKNQNDNENRNNISNSKGINISNPPNVNIVINNSVNIRIA